MQRIAYWMLLGVTLAVYAVMLVWTLPTVSDAAGGLVPFDMRPGGYGLEDARQFLLALSPDGETFYRTVQQRLDIAYPALIALTLFFALKQVLPATLGAWRGVLAAPALAVAVFDYAENHAVAAMLDAGPGGLTHELVANANAATMLKSGFTTIAMVALLGLLCWRGGLGLYRRLHPTTVH